MSKPTKKVLVFAGSLRAASFNKKLAQQVTALAKAQGAEATYIDLNDYPLPIYNGDIEDTGMPENVHKLQQLVASHDALCICTPEYNGAVPALVKNTLDWVSREQADGEPGIAVLRNKVVALFSASPGALGGLRALLLLRDQMAKLGMWVAPNQFALGKAHEAFADNGTLKSEDNEEKIRAVINQLLSF